MVPKPAKPPVGAVEKGMHIVYPRNTYIYRLCIYGCFLKWWYPQNTPKWTFLVGKPMVVGYHHFRKPPYIRCICCWLYTLHLCLLSTPRCSLRWWDSGRIIPTIASRCLAGFSRMSGHVTGCLTLHGTSISHLGGRKLIFKITLGRDMLVPCRL